MPRARRSIWLNGALAAALVGAAALSWTAVGGAASAPAQTRTATAARGVVLSTVSATGNVSPADNLAVNFKSGGRLAEVDATVGQRVTAGQVLAKVDPTDAQSSLTSAQANLASAQGRLTQLEMGLTPQEQNQSQASAIQAQVGVQSAQIALANAENMASIDANNLQSAVSQAESQLASDHNQLSADQAQQSQDQQRLNQDQSSGASSQQVQQDQSAVSADQQKVATDQNNVAKDESTVVSAENAQVTGQAKDQQSVDQARSQLASAQASLQSALAANAVKAQPPKPGDLATARAAVVTAQAAVGSAQRTVNDTTLTAPANGTVAAVSSHVGEFVGSSGGGGASSSSSSSSSSSGGGGASTGSTSGGSGSGSGSSSGFITLVDLDVMQVTAGFSEADAAKVQLGQPATITLDALPNQELAAHVVSIDTTQTVVSNVVTYNATLALDRTADGVKPGMTAGVQVVVSRKEGVLNVPSAAVRGSGASASVSVLEGKVQRTVAVVTGVKGDTTTEIVSGLTAGQQVVLPSARLSTGATGGTTGVSGRGGGGGAGGIGGAGVGGGITGVGGGGGGGLRGGGG